MEQKHIETNRILWDKKTAIHKDAEFYNLKGFLAGETSLKEIELSALKDRIKGKSVLHLQCHFGQDSLSLARLGAKVTGVDFSEVSIELGRSLNEELDLDVKFVVSDIYSLPENLSGQFDFIFTSYGVLTWLPDLDRWASVVSHFLKPGGTFYMAEFHPTLYMYDHDNQKIGYRYFDHTEPYEEVEEGTYADTNADIAQREYFWSHSLASVFQSLLKQKFHVVDFQEFDFSPYNCFPHMEETTPDRFVYGDLINRMPHVFSIEMRK
jgi:SAM-dependent methyltransferase